MVVVSVRNTILLLILPEKYAARSSVGRDGRIGIRGLRSEDIMCTIIKANRNNYVQSDSLIASPHYGST
jgi:hypothetical protein